MGGVTILEKGGDDMISNGSRIPSALLQSSSEDTDMLVDSVQGGLKRVGGQGDILCGTVATLLAWGREWANGTYKHVGHAPTPDEEKDLVPHIAVLAAYGGSAFNRTVSRRGWEEKKRAMVTHDLIELIGPVYHEMFGRWQEAEGESGGKEGKENKGKKGKL